MITVSTLKRIAGNAYLLSINERCDEFLNNFPAHQYTCIDQSIAKVRALTCLTKGFVKALLRKKCFRFFKFVYKLKITSLQEKHFFH